MVERTDEQINKIVERVRGSLEDNEIAGLSTTITKAIMEVGLSAPDGMAAILLTLAFHIHASGLPLEAVIHLFRNAYDLTKEPFNEATGGPN